MNAATSWKLSACRAFAAALALVFSIAFSGNAVATPSDLEARTIDALIQRVAGMKDVTFIRNGAEGTAGEAAKHLSDKYAYFRREIKTAEDFIRLCGTRSELSGKAYTVRLPDGSLLPAAELLTRELMKVRAGSV